MRVDLAVDDDVGAVCTAVAAQTAAHVDFRAVAQTVLFEEGFGNLNIAGIAACEARTAQTDNDFFHEKRLISGKLPPVIGKLPPVYKREQRRPVTKYRTNPVLGKPNFSGELPHGWRLCLRDEQDEQDEQDRQDSSQLRDAKPAHPAQRSQRHDPRSGSKHA